MKSGSDPTRTTLKMVADAAGVSPTLASFALNGKDGVSKKRREKILRVAADLGYSPDPLARELRTGKTQMYGFIVRNFANPFFNDVLAGMQKAAFDDDITVIAMDSNYSRDRERSYIRNLSARRVTRLAIAPVGGAESITPLLELLLAETKIVLVNSSTTVAGDVTHVSPDAVSAVTQAFDHLWQLGHRRIAFLSAPPELMSDVDRFSTYQNLCASHEAPLMPIFTPLDAASIVQNVEIAQRVAEPPTAIITNSDFSAHYVYIAAQRLGLTIGRDLSVVGHDDLDTSSLLSPPMTTLHVDRSRLGREVYRRLAGEIDGDHHEPVQLIKRSSTGPAVTSHRPNKIDTSIA